MRKFVAKKTQKAVPINSFPEQVAFACIPISSPFSSLRLMAIFHMDVADNTVALVTKHCGLQLEFYQKCVTQNPENWDIKCITQKRALAKCSEDK